MLRQRALAAAAVAAAGQVRREESETRRESHGGRAMDDARSPSRLFFSLPSPSHPFLKPRQLRPLLQQSTRSAVLNASAATADASQASVSSALRSFFASSSSTTTTTMLRQRGGDGIARGAGKHSASSRTTTTRSFNTYSDMPADAAGQVRMLENEMRGEEKLLSSRAKQSKG